MTTTDTAAPAAAPPASSWTQPATRRGPLTRSLRALLGPQIYTLVRQAQWAAGEEIGDRRFGWREKLWAWRRGFLADSAALFELTADNWRDYLPDYARENRAVLVNGVPQLFDQKLMLRALLLHHGFAQAETFALIGRADAQFHPLAPDARLVSFAALEELMRVDGSSFIVKPQDSGSGHGVALVESQDGQLVRRRGAARRRYRVGASRTTTLVERVIPQHPFWRAFYPDSANTMRLLTMWTPGDAAPFIAAAAQRVGASDTAPTDNFSGGGMAAAIDLATGRLGKARRRTPSGRPEHLTHHPESGAPIAGAELPYWDRIRETVLRAASVVGVARYVGWDVLVDEAGTPVIIEGNSNTGVHVLQLGEGLLKNPSARRFYETCGVV